ncbi:MAG: DUF262 domain-containing protein [Deltaproteobacteria bacterium]|nr:DUF262 domain-containing protein [Deltaproteobacteria bacterium]
MRQPQNVPLKYDHLFAAVDTGRLKIPMFQRDFVWTTSQTAALLDSIIKGYPIGTFIFWKTREAMRHFRNIGNVELPRPPDGDSVQYVLDGQQRITSLYAVRKGVRITKDGEEQDYKRVAIDLSFSADSEDPVVVAEPPEGSPFITLYTLLNGSVTELARDYAEHLEKVDIYRKRLTGFDFATVVIEDYPLDVACEVFTRINTGGTKLTLFEIMVAKTYDPDKGFDLAHEYTMLLDSSGAEKDLEDAGFDTVPEQTVLQCIAAHVSGQLRARDILKLDKDAVIGSWPTVKEGIFAAVDFVRTHLRVPVSRLLPYHTVLVPFAYFFIRNDLQMPTPEQTRRLAQYLFWASLSQRFSSGVEGKIVRDLARMDDIRQQKQPDYKGEELHLTIDDLKARPFSTGNAVCLALLCLYAYQEPKSFASNGVVKLDNSWLKVASSKNYHHFFPKAHLRRAGDDSLANSILNITLVDDHLNKRKAKSRAPSDYMREFRDSNPQLGSTMKTHLIDDLDKFGVWDDDYGRFLTMRGQRVMEELVSWLGSDCLVNSPGESRGPTDGSA